jgi:hypothetical protein
LRAMAFLRQMTFCSLFHSRAAGLAFGEKIGNSRY